MSKANNNHQIIFIHRDKLIFCNQGKTAPSKFPLTADLVKDLGVVDQLKLEKSLKEFIEKFKTPASETLIILNKNTYFRTTIENPKPILEDNKDEVDKFSDLVPFNDIFVKKFMFQKKLEVVATNREFYEPILSVLQKIGLQITTILPEFVVENLIGKGDCTPEEHAALLKAADKSDDYDLLGSKHKLEVKKDEEIAPIKEKNKKLTNLLIVFGVLIAILIGALIFNANRTYDDPEPSNSQDSIPSSITKKTEATSSAEGIRFGKKPTDLESSDSSSSAEVIDLDNYKIRVLNGSGISGQASLVENDLKDAGFSDIDIGNSKKISSNKTQILITPTLPATIKELIIKVVKNIGQEYTIQENSELNYDIVITTTAAE